MAGNQEHEEWVKESKLGQGGFGQVYLYRNRRTNEKIAVKKCGGEITDKVKEKWQQEIDIMKQINHPNIVKALRTPPELQAVTQSPILVMEYCSGGDLRSLLVKSPCGLKEHTVRWLVDNIAKGIEHLHSIKITHRDIKPENIVIARTGAGERDVVYKIIDLGYAKTLFDSSILQSFVGTMQYLAPELMSKNNYTRTVDFWSFGVVLHECITGIRPFLPTEVPFRWYEQVKMKKPDEICIHYNIEGEVTHSDKIVFPNRLCRTSKAFFEQFLRLMLRWDPDTRGGKAERETGNRDKCWSLLDNILKSPLLFIYCFPNNKMLTYPVEDKHTIRDVLKALERETSLTDMELIFTNGINPAYSAKAKEFSGQDEGPSLYLFRKLTRENEASVFPKLDETTEEYPELVRFMLQRPNNQLNQEDQVKFMSQAAYYCEEKFRQFCRIQTGSTAAWMNASREMSEISKHRKTVESDLVVLQSLVELSIQGFQFDIDQYEAQSLNANGQPRFEARRSVQRWADYRDQMANMKPFFEREACAWDNKYKVLQEQLEELKKHTGCPLKTHTIPKALFDLTQKSAEIYREVRKSSKSSASNADSRPTNRDMLECVHKIMNDSNKHSEDVYGFLRDLLLTKQKMLELHDLTKEHLKKIGESKEQIKSFQRQKQEDMWSFIRQALRSRRASSGATSPTPAFQTSLMMTQTSMETSMAINEYQNLSSSLRRMESANSLHGTGEWSMLERIDES